MTPRTPHSLVTAWVALEDVHPDAGPPVYYPGSHKIPLYTFNDGSHHASRDEIVDWFDYIDVQLRLRGLRGRKLMARKGDVLIWHSDLVHGGSPIADFSRTCASVACHYFSASDCVERGMDIEPLNGGYWLRRLQPPVIVDPAAFGPGFPFPEESYLRRYPDVREAVGAGSFARRGSPTTGCTVSTRAGESRPGSRTAAGDPEPAVVREARDIRPLLGQFAAHRVVAVAPAGRREVG